MFSIEPVDVDSEKDDDLFSDLGSMEDDLTKKEEPYIKPTPVESDKDKDKKAGKNPESKTSKDKLKSILKSRRKKRGIEDPADSGDEQGDPDDLFSELEPMKFEEEE